MKKVNRRQSIRTPAIAGLKRSLTAQKRTFFTEPESKPLVKQMLIAVQKMHKLGIVHRDLNPGNIFLHFPTLPAIHSPGQVEKDDDKSPISKWKDKFTGSIMSTVETKNC